MAKRQLERKREGKVEEEEEAEERPAISDFQAEKYRQEHPELFRKEEAKRAPVQAVAERKVSAKKEELKQEVAKALKKEEKLVQERVQVKEEKRELSLIEGMKQDFAQFKTFIKDQFPQNEFEITAGEAADRYYFKVSTPSDWHAWAMWLPYDEYESIVAPTRPLNVMGKIKKAFIGKKKKE